MRRSPPGPAYAAPATLSVGFAKNTITPVGPSPAGWGFIPQPITQVWGEQFFDLNGNGCYDLTAVPPQPFVDDIRNTEIDPQSAGKWDGISTNAGFGGKCALGKLDDTWARAVFQLGRQDRGDGLARRGRLVPGGGRPDPRRAGLKHPAIRLDALIVAATHVHEGPDTMGLWSASQGYVLDGKYPLYQQYIRARVVSAIATAYYARETAYVKFARGTETRGLRDSRGPTVFDPDVWAAEFVRPLSGATIGTLVNWSNHPEALGGDNPYISSDYPGGVRSRMEAVRGGTAIFFSGSVGGLMTPLSVNNVPGFPSDDHSHARAMKIGEIVADAAIAALATAPYAPSTEISVAHKDFIIPFENLSLVALNEAGLFDRELTLDASGQAGVLTEMYAVRLGPAVFITVPGELFPEIANGGYGRDLPGGNAEEYCPEADSGRPYEPVIRDQFSRHVRVPVRPRPGRARLHRAEVRLLGVRVPAVGRDVPDSGSGTAAGAARSRSAPADLHRRRRARGSVRRLPLRGDRVGGEHDGADRRVHCSGARRARSVRHLGHRSRVRGLLTGQPDDAARRHRAAGSVR